MYTNSFPTALPNPNKVKVHSSVTHFLPSTKQPVWPKLAKCLLYIIPFHDSVDIRPKHAYKHTIFTKHT